LLRTADTNQSRHLVHYDEIEGIAVDAVIAITASIAGSNRIDSNANDSTAQRCFTRPASDTMYFAKSAMRNILFLVVILSCLLPPAWPQSVKTVLGAWEGESKCTVPNSPCHDEHVLYQVAQDRRDPWQLNVDGYKIIDGAPEFMGTLTCQYQSKSGALSCTSSSKEKDDWEFRVFGDAMSGKLTIDDGKTTYRRITLHKVQK
jgi:hypothetical protein